MEKIAITIRGVKSGKAWETEVVGFHIGPFVVHKAACIDQQKWVCTHVKTGFCAFDSPNRTSATIAAERLRTVGADWDFDDPGAVKEFPASMTADIKGYCALARAGGW